MSKSARPDLEGVFMTVPHASVERAIDQAEPLTIDTAYARSRQAALAPSVVGAVGLEIETHLVDLDAVADRVAWDRVDPMPDPGRHRRRAQRGHARARRAAGAVRAAGAGHAEHDQRVAPGRAAHPAGPGRPRPRPGPRGRRPAPAVPARQPAAAVPRHGASTSPPPAGPSAGAVDDELDRRAPGEPRGRARKASGRNGSPARTGSGRRMVAISASSPWLHGRDTGWKSARQRAWSGLDARRVRPGARLRAPDTGRRSALTPPRPGPGTRCAPRSRSSGPRATTSRPCAHRSRSSAGPAARSAWAAGRPTAADLDTHLTTLFPPVRLRGYLELRYLDMPAPRWWPAIAAVTATLMDDPVAADQAAEATEPAAQLWTDGRPRRAWPTPRSPTSAAPLRGDRGRARSRPSSARASPTWPSWSSPAGAPGDLLAERIDRDRPARRIRGGMAHA